MRVLFFIWVLFSSEWTLVAQTNRLSGSIADSLSKQPLPYATVQLKNQYTQQATTTDANGQYTFKKLEAGSYELGVAYVGYNNKSITIEINASETTTPVIALSLANINLKEVKVKASKPLFLEEVGKTIVNVAESVLANAGSVVDVLKYAPSLIINDNSISIRGKEAMILIDGRQTNLTGESLEGILNALPSNSIEKIEIISNPSAKYDATGKAVIHIRTLKMKNLGTTGNYTLGAGTGRLPRYNTGILLNHRTQKLSFVGNFTHQQLQQYVDFEATRTIKNALETSFIDNDFDNRKRRTEFLKFGLDYAITPRTTVGMLFQSDQNTRTRNADGTTKISNTGRLDSVVTLQTQGKVRYQNRNGNLFFRHEFKQKGREMALDADYGYYHTDFWEATDNRFLNAARTLNYRPSLVVSVPWTQPIQIQSLRGNYVHPTTKGSLDAGFQLRHTTVNTDFEYQSQVDGRLVTDAQKSFLYNYTEQVNAAYINYAAKEKKWNYQVGLRLEDSHAKGQTQKSTQINRQDYLQLFPSASLQYAPSDTHQYAVSYSRKISRPSYTNLNDQIVYINPFRQVIGNPLLQPTIMTNVELSYLYNRVWSVVLSYSNKANDWTNNLFIENNTLVSQLQNMPQEIMISTDVSYRKSVNKIWRTASGLMLFQVRSRLGNFEGIDFRVGNSYYLYTNNFFTFKNNWRADFTASYVSPQALGIYIISPFIQTNVSIQKTLLHKNAELRLSFSDIFNTLYVGQDYNTISQRGFNHRKIETQYLQLSFNYKFGNNNVKVKDRKIGIDRESSRINQNQ
jgi:iron complex outermembrane recepter protein